MIHSLAFEADTQFKGVYEFNDNPDGTRHTRFECSTLSLVAIRQKADEVMHRQGGGALISMEVMQYPGSDNMFLLVEDWRKNV